VDTDRYVEDNQTEYRLIVDKEKAALSGVCEQEIAQTMEAEASGRTAGLLHVPTAKEDIPMLVRLARQDRFDMNAFQNVPLRGASRQTISFGILFIRSKQL
jgi:multidrug efflux pump subunit AcrB